tara:strand:- start:53130 stop:54152 length:1023 start_codon:yes stop_codon:yes gene_type:complete
MPRKTKGVLLTLGITFLALVVLTLATLILRNAETSEERLVELAGIDRLYNLGSSTERSLAESLYPYTGVYFNITNDTIIIARQMHPWPDNTLWSIDWRFFDYKLTLMTIFPNYINSVSKGVNSLNKLDAAFNRIMLLFEPSGSMYWLSTIPFHVEDYGYPNLTINNETFENSNVYSTYQFFVPPAVTDPTYPTSYTFYFKSTDANPIINWSRKATEGNPKVNLKIIVEGLNGYHDEVSALVPLNATGTLFPHVIYLDNLTAEAKLPPPFNIEKTEKKPSIRFYESNKTNNLFAIFNFDVELYTEVIIKLNTTYTEAYTLQEITTQLPGFGMKRTRLARYA